jgi:hypothetical protein
VQEAPQRAEPSAAVKPEYGKAPDAKAAPAATKPIEPPARWTKEEKETFATLDPNIQKVLLNRNKGLEADYTRKMTEIAQERQRYNGLEQTLSSRRQEMARYGVDDVGAINTLFSYWDRANADPASFIMEFCQARGIDLAQYFAPTPEQIAKAYGVGGPDAPNGEIHPAIRAQMESIAKQQQQLQQAVQSQQQYVQQQQMDTHRSYVSAAANEMNAFATAADEHGQPLYPFFADVRKEMAVIMQNGFANTLHEAYEIATRVRGDVFSKIEENREIMRRRSEDQRRQEEAARARRAGASVSASSSGYSPQVSGDEEEGLSLRQTIERQFERARASARI